METIYTKKDVSETGLIFKLLVDRKISQQEASERLNISTRQTRRLLKAFRKQGVRGLEPKKKGGNHCLLPGTREKVVELIKEYYLDFGPTFATEKLKERHGLNVSSETVRKWLIQAELWKANQKKPLRVHQSRRRRPRFGELIQMDGSPHDWFEGRRDKCCLLVLVDDATSKLVGLRFEEGETTLGYMRAISDHLNRYGKPISYYTDKHSIFKVNKKDCIDGRLRDTEFHQSLRDLGIELICAHSPQAKGRVERANNTLQKRLTRELRLRNISTLEEANDYLSEFMESYNKQFGVAPEEEEDAHHPLGINQGELDLILSIREKRKVDKNLQLSFYGEIYQILEECQGRRIQGQGIEIRKTLSGKVKLMFEDKELKYQVYRPLKRLLEADSKEIDQVMDKLIKQQKKPSQATAIDSDSLYQKNNFSFPPMFVPLVNASVRAI